MNQNLTLNIFRNIGDQYEKITLTHLQIGKEESLKIFKAELSWQPAELTALLLYHRD